MVDKYGPEDLGWIDARIATRKRINKMKAKNRKQKKSHRIIRGSRRW